MNKVTRIKVTKSDIQNGRPGYSDSCPIALAVKRKFPGSDVSVGYFDFDVQHGPADKEIHGRMLPERAQRFVDEFDGNSPVEPFQFDVKAIPEG